MRLPEEDLECVIPYDAGSLGQLSVRQPERLDLFYFFAHLVYRETPCGVPVEEAADEGVGFGGDGVGVAEVVWVVAEVEVVEIGGGEGVFPGAGAGYLRENLTSVSMFRER